MSAIKAVVVANDMVTAYGWGVDACWQGLLSGQTAIRVLNRFCTKSFQSQNAATVSELDPDKEESLVMQMLVPLFSSAGATIPEDAFLILATTTGEIDILQKHILSGEGNVEESRPDCLLNKIQRLTGIRDPGMVVSAACASSGTAIAQAAAMIASGQRDRVLVVACDSVCEFIFSGFSSLMALDKDAARPFDKDRAGLSIGEAAGYVLMMSEDRALQEQRQIIGQIKGWGLTNDANHMTGPSRNGSGLAQAISKSLQSANMDRDAVGCICAHGTGTIYNDAMEMKAVKKVFSKAPVPMYSIKGGIGHTMGAAGLVEIIVALRSLSEKVIPPTVNLRAVDDEAVGWVLAEPQTFESRISVSTNAGFGGVNVALLLSSPTLDSQI